MSVHDPKLIKKNVAFIGARFTLTCRCENVPGRWLDHSEAREEMQRHEVSGS